MKGKIFTDGGSRGNPGHAGTASLLFDENNILIDFYSKAYELMTNNQAEYNAFIDGLNIALKNGYTDLVCFLDSELVVKQINGIYKIKDEKIKSLMPLIQDLLKQFKSILINHIPREKNKLADKLVNITLDAFEKS
jgi:ribonuclease HI